MAVGEPPGVILLSLNPVNVSPCVPPNGSPLDRSISSSSSKSMSELYSVCDELVPCTGIGLSAIPSVSALESLSAGLLVSLPFVEWVKIPDLGPDVQVSERIWYSCNGLVMG